MRGKPTPAWDLGNVTIWEEYISTTLVVANSLVLLITSLVGVASNIFVILAVYHQKSLQTSANALVVNLAVIDSMRCIIDCPILLTIIMTVHQQGHVDSLICEAQMASFSFSCCVQLLTLACISADRYQAIAQPFKINQRKKRIMVLIPLTWTLAILVAVLCLIFLNDSPVYVRCQGMLAGTTSYDTNGFYMLLPLWVVCFGVITGFYAGIFALLRSHNRKIFDEGTFLSKKVPTKDKEKRDDITVAENGHGKPDQEQIPSKNIAQTPVEPNPIKKQAILTLEDTPQIVSVSSEKKEEFKNTKMSHKEPEQPHCFAVRAAVQSLEETLKTEQCSLRSIKTEVKALERVVAANDETSNTVMQKVLSNSDSDEQSREGLKTDKAGKETTPLVVLSAQLEGPQSTSVLPANIKPAQNSDREETLTVATQDQGSSQSPAAGQNIELEGAVCMMPSKTSKERARKKKESKMAKRAGYIIVTFLFFWLPLITTILMNFLVHKNKNKQISIIQDLEILTVSVACITSLSDPIIYAAINPQFRAEFYKLRSWVKSKFSKN